MDQVSVKGKSCLVGKLLVERIVGKDTIKKTHQTVETYGFFDIQSAGRGIILSSPNLNMNGTNQGYWKVDQGFSNRTCEPVCSSRL